jgi:hypothetical protein
MRAFPLVLLGLAVFRIGVGQPTNDLFHYGAPFDLRVDQVRSLGAEQKVGLSRVPHIYAVEGVGDHRHYTLYCTKIAPEAGQTYHVQEDLVGANFSFLHLWPVDRRDATFSLPAKGPQLYRVVTFFDLLKGKQTDVTCDIYKLEPSA